MTTAHLFAFNSTIAAELKERLARVDESGRDVLSAPLKFKPSVHQQAFFEWLAGDKGSCILKAVAGSGKTTSIVAGLRYIPGLMARDIRASTFHSVGLAAVMKKLGLRTDNIKIDGNKVRQLAKLMLTDDERDLYEAFACKLVGLAKGEGIGCLTPSTEDAWFRLIEHHDLSLDVDGASEADGIHIARRLLQASSTLALPKEKRILALPDGCPEAPVIDFDDMLYLPLLWKCRLWQDDYVFVDEAQDTNPVRRAIAKLKLKPGGRLIAVGDPKQAIYGFTGASADAMDLIAKEFSCIELPLTVSYRCPKAVAEKVRALVPYFETPPMAKEGSVKACTLKDALPLLTHQDAILCRQTAPLVCLALGLLARGTPCHVLGREIGQGLVALVEKLGRSRGVDGLILKLEAYRLREVAKHTAKGEEMKAAGVEDRVACVLAILDALPERERTVPGFKRRVDGMFADEGFGGLTLATIHKVKGKEFPRVAILAPELMPSKWARQQWQIEQELHLQYVAWTRPQEMIIELTDDILPPVKAMAKTLEEV